MVKYYIFRNQRLLESLKKLKALKNKWTQCGDPAIRNHAQKFYAEERSRVLGLFFRRNHHGRSNASGGIFAP